MTIGATIATDGLFSALEDDREAASQYLSIFIDEAQTTIDELIEALLALESGGGAEHVQPLFVAAHRIKGSAATIGLNRVAKLAHLMEDLLQTLVDDGRVPTPPITDALLSCTDGLRQHVNALRDGRPTDDHFPALAQELLAAAATEQKPATSAVQSALPTAPAIGVPADALPGITDDLRRRVAALVREDEHDEMLLGQVMFEPALPLVGLKAQLVFDKLSNLGELRYFDPPQTTLDALEALDGVVFGLATRESAEQVRRGLQLAGVMEVSIEPLATNLAGGAACRAEAGSEKGGAAERSAGTSAASSASALKQPQNPESTCKPSETLRVDIQRLDQLMNLAGQLAIGKARMTQIADRLKLAVSESNLAQARDGIGELSESIHLLDRVSDGIQQGVMDMRMLPIGPLFGRFHRVVRDMARTSGKDIRLVISGESTELDKRMIDELGDPMIHMIRNAADHGIEVPEVRAAAGKPRQGTIALSAFHRGSSIVIRVADDGRGLDPQRILQKAVDRGLVAPADAERMSPQQIYQLIWLPGLSTAEKITEVSGRGVGMDIVRARIKDLSGAVEVESEPGRGTTLTIKLPLTLAILPCLMVGIDGDVFAVPLESVVEIVNVGAGDRCTVHGRNVASVRDRVISILRLGRVFHWGHGRREAQQDEAAAITLVILGDGSQQLGLAVDQVLGEEDVVIKSIADNFRNVGGIAGASILGDGRLSLILDPHALIEMSSRFGPAVASTLENRL